PSELTPLTSVAIQHIANKVMADHGLSGLFNLMIGDGPTIGEMMTSDRRLPLISFTGSTRTGRKVSQAVAARFGRTILELGGNNAIIIAEDANLDMTVRAVLFGSVGTAGQRCTSTRRLIVHENVVDELTARLAKAYKQVPIGDPLVDGTLMGPLATPAAVAQMGAALV
ncbi:aldehyde dehydrogenase family protein, partial [bacterium]|nr:aldehyde dehydrogenase family protein [bacterium]